MQRTHSEGDGHRGARRAARLKHLACALACSTPAWAGAADAAAWDVVGRQGLVQMVIVPAAQAADRAAYQEQLARLCVPEQTCFVNFYANPTGAKVQLPLPDEVDHAATARYRFSAKNGVRVFQWSCRMKQDEGECF